MEAMKLTFVNVGYGEAMVLQCPDPSRPGGAFVMVIDGGSGEAAEYAGSDTGRGTLADWFAQDGPDHIDVLSLTHIHEDHICGLPAVTERLRPGALWQTLPPAFYRALPEFPPFPGIDPSQDKFRRALNDYRRICAQSGEAHILTLSAGWRCSPCPGLTVTALAPSAQTAKALEEDCRSLALAAGGPDYPAKLTRLDKRMNNYSLMLLLEYRGARVLLPGDTNCAGYGGLDTGALRADLFKVGHHGQRDGASAALLDAVRPKAVVCCASSDRRYDSAHPDTLRLIQERGAAVYFSDCPRLPGLDLPPHRALVFRLTGPGSPEAFYL